MHDNRSNSSFLSGPADNADTSLDPAVTGFRERHPDDTFEGASGVLYEQAMAKTHMAICLCDPRQDDVPIVFANAAFKELTGFEHDEVVGRNCRFLQGPETDRDTVALIRHAVEHEEVCVVEILNYRKDGTPFWNALHLGPVYDADGRLVYLFGSQWDVTEVRTSRSDERHARELARELSHRMKNMFAVIGSIVNFTGRARGIEGEAREINERIQALGRAYETTLDDSHRGSVEVGQAIRAVLAPYDPDGARFTFEGNGLRSDFASVSVLGLSLHELAIDAIRNGALGTENGRVTVAWQRNGTADGPAIRIDWVEQGGAARIATVQSGDGIVERMLESARGGITREWHQDGLRARLNIPLREAAQ